MPIIRQTCQKLLVRRKPDFSSTLLQAAQSFYPTVRSEFPQRDAVRPTQGDHTPQHPRTGAINGERPAFVAASTSQPEDQPSGHHVVEPHAVVPSRRQCLAILEKRKRDHGIDRASTSRSYLLAIQIPNCHFPALVAGSQHPTIRSCRAFTRHQAILRQFQASNLKRRGSWLKC